MKALDANWYKSIWSLDIKEQSWVEDIQPGITAYGVLEEESFINYTENLCFTQIYCYN